MEHDAREVTRIMLRPLANPLPLGLIGLAAATILASGNELGWLPVTETHQLGYALLIIAVPLQLVASVIGFAARDAVAATAMGTLGVTWLTLGVLHIVGVPGTRSQTLGLFLFVMAAALLISAATAGMGKGLAAIVLALTALRWALTGSYQYAGGTSWAVAAGWTGVALCVVALYAALAFEVEDMRHHTVLPTLRRGSARHAFDAPDLGTHGAADREAGVREQL